MLPVPRKTGDSSAPLYSRYRRVPVIHTFSKADIDIGT